MGLSRAVFRRCRTYSELNFLFWIYQFNQNKYQNGQPCSLCHCQLQDRPCSMAKTSYLCCSESNGQPHIDHIRQQKWHRLCCQIHWCRSCYRRSGRIRSRNRISLRISYRWLCQKSIPQTTTVFIRHFGICFVRSYGPFLSYDGLFAPVRLLEK